MNAPHQREQFELRIRVSHPDLVNWLRELPPDLVARRAEDALLAGYTLVEVAHSDVNHLLAEFGAELAEAQAAVVKRIKQVADAAIRADHKIEEAVENFSWRLSGGLLAVPAVQTVDSRLPEATQPHIVLDMVEKMGQKRDLRSDAFLGLYEVAYKQRLHINVQDGDTWVLFDGKRKVAWVRGAPGKVDVVFPLAPNQPVTVLPPIETVTNGELVIDGSDVPQMLDRVRKRLSVRVSQSVSV